VLRLGRLLHFLRLLTMDEKQLNVFDISHNDVVILRFYQVYLSRRREWWTKPGRSVWAWPCGSCAACCPWLAPCATQNWARPYRGRAATTRTCSRDTGRCLRSSISGTPCSCLCTYHIAAIWPHIRLVFTIVTNRLRKIIRNGWERSEGWRRVGGTRKYSCICTGNPSVSTPLALSYPLKI